MSSYKIRGSSLCVRFLGVRYSRAIAFAAVSAFSLASPLIFTACSERKSEVTESGTQKEKYVLGTKVQFGIGGNSDAFRSSGWSRPEQDFTWSDGTSAVLTLVIDPSPAPLLFRATIQGLTKEPELPFQPVLVYVNQTQVAEWQVGPRAENSATIPLDLVKSGGTLRIEFKLPKAISPSKLGLSDDPRTLALAMCELQITQLPR